jgi:cell shape-determining protein MreD
MLNKNISWKIINLSPVIFLYFFSISEIDTHFENFFEILSFNIQLIIIYFWVLKNPSVLGNGHIFFAGLINDVILGFPLGLSSLTYLVISLVATYVKNMSVHTTLTSDWFTFLVGLIISNSVFLLLISNFSEINISFTEISYNTFFTLLFFPFFWFLFSYFNSIMSTQKNV